MALYKEIVQDDGVVTCYHRILYLQITTNRQNSIGVISYVDNNSRDKEKSETIAQPYVKAITYETDYDPKMSVETAYEYLKSLPEFKGAKDV